MTEYNLSKKIDGKWKTIITIRNDPKYGNLRASAKITPEFRKLIEESGDWLNLSVFEHQPKEASNDSQETEEPIPF